MYWACGIQPSLMHVRVRAPSFLVRPQLFLCYLVCFPKFNPWEILEMFKTGGRGAGKQEYLQEAIYLSCRDYCLCVSVPEQGLCYISGFTRPPGTACNHRGVLTRRQTHLRLIPPMAFNTASHCSWCLRVPLQGLGPELEGSLWPALHNDSRAPDC